ncbi:MAG: hypothetical protein KAR21_04060 [Spirochaetales bacterium]|nr:hypothetical protein [Spirochaetales bacterium]
MPKLKLHTYIMDNLSDEKGDKIRKALQKIPEIKSITISTTEGTVSLLSIKDYETEVKLACDIAGVSFRIKIKTKKGLFF